MKKIDFKSQIRETEEELSKLEKKTKHPRLRDRIRMFRLLKTGKYFLKDLAELFNLSERTIIRIWNAYKEGGLEKVLQWNVKGRKARISPQILFSELNWKKNPPSTLQEAQKILKEQYNINYSLSGIWYLFRSHGIKTVSKKNYRKSTG